MKNNGVKNIELLVVDIVVCDIVCYYICEVGVWVFECEIFKICCKVVKMLLFKKCDSWFIVNVKNLDKFFGVCCYSFGMVEKDN